MEGYTVTDIRTDAERKAYNLHVALSDLLRHYTELLKDTDSWPTFESPNDPDNVAGRALFDNAPLADWEPPTPMEDAALKRHTVSGSDSADDDDL
jgi:hypothetical protein